jgi:tRNA 2-thiouridine synthesizing protein A
LADALTSLDLCGLKCPLPALRTRKALRGLADGDRLDVACTDPLSVIDIPHLLRQTGDVLDGMDEANDVVTFHIRRVKKSQMKKADR